MKLKAFSETNSYYCHLDTTRYFVYASILLDMVSDSLTRLEDTIQ